MYNEIMDAVTKQLSALFPPEAGYTVYTDADEQGLSASSSISSAYEMLFSKGVSGQSTETLFFCTVFGAF